jgi:hypothetical protein
MRRMCIQIKSATNDPSGVLAHIRMRGDESDGAIWRAASSDVHYARIEVAGRASRDVL